MYIPVKIKYTFTLLIACSWMLLSIWLSYPWLQELSAYIGKVPAIIIISFLAYIPGFMTSFLFIGYLVDKRIPPKPLKSYPGISVLIPAYNEELTIESTINSVLNQDYLGDIEIIIIDDGSKDHTVEIIETCFNDKLMLLKGNHNGKAEALNTGLLHSKHDLIITIDADTYVRPDGITEIVKQLAHDPPNTVGVAGSVYVRNSRYNWMTRMQEWDYFHAIAAIKRMQSLFQGTLVAQGCFSIYRKEALIEIGGWPSVVGEDIVMTWGLLSKGYRTGFADQAICFTNAPTTYKQFFYQRSRWSSGLIEAFRAYPKMLYLGKLVVILVYWNLLFPLLDLTLVFIFIPGVILTFFGNYLIAGPMTLAVLPIAILYNLAFFFGQRKVFRHANLRVRKNILGFILYMISYQLLMAPACVHGYFLEIFHGGRKRWGTK